MDNDIYDIFRQYDKLYKGYLTKHELKCALIYKIGQKLDYESFINLWNNRDDFYKQKGRGSRGINLEYFEYICTQNSSIIPSKDKLLEIEFHSLCGVGKNYLDFESFKKLYGIYGATYMNEKMQRDVFNKLDVHQDNQITLKDYKRIFND